jgi:predicted permease
MPSQTQSSLWAQENGADAEYAAGGIALSTLVGLVAIPAYAWVLTVL